MIKPKAKARAKPEPDRLPPHSIEAELGLLGCLMLDPSGLENQAIKPSVFYDHRHAEVFKAMRDVFSAAKTFDVITLQEHLKKRKLLTEIGGLEFLSTLEENTPSAANLPHYLQIVKEKFELRKIVATCADVIDVIYNHNGEISELKYSVKSQLGEVFSDDAGEDIGDSATWNQLLDFNTENDSNCVIGMNKGKTTRWLCKGHGAWLIGPSGVGKSSLALLLAVAFSAGLSMWGITPVKPLRVLVVQAENDMGDMAEMSKGIEAGLGVNIFSDETASKMISDHLKVKTVTGKIGQSFCMWLQKQIIEHKADLVLCDPLLSFAGIDVSRQDQTSQFLRVWLDPVLRETGAVLLSVHHTGKPPRGEKGKGEPTLYDMAYSGIGSSELVNWARAIMLLQPAGEGAFRLILAKRGKRAWARHPSGEFTQMLWLRHAQSGIFWEQIEPPAEPEPTERKTGKPSKVKEVASMNLHGFCADCKADGEGLNAISKRLESWLAKQGEDVSEKTAKRIIPELVRNGKLAKGEDSLYRKGANA